MATREPRAVAVRSISIYVDYLNEEANTNETTVAIAIATAVLLACALTPPTLLGQSAAIADVGTPRGKLSFEVASVKIDKAGLPPQGPRQSLNVKDGYFSMVNCGVFCLISFAYHLSPDELVRYLSAAWKGDGGAI